MRSPSGVDARRRGGTQIGKAPPSPEMTTSGLTRGWLVGDDDDANQFITPALPDVRPAPQAGCFVSGLYASCESQRTCDSLTFGTCRRPVSIKMHDELATRPGWRLPAGARRNEHFHTPVL